MFRALPADPALHVRLALLYEAASRREQRGHAVDPAVGIPDWLAVWLWEAGTYTPVRRRELGHTRPRRGDARGRRRAARRGDPRDASRAAGGSVRDDPAATLLTALGDLPGAAARHPDAIGEALHHGEAKRLVRVLEILAQKRVDLAPHAARVAELVASPAKTVRARALTILHGIPDAADAPLRVIAAARRPRRAVDGLPQGGRAHDRGGRKEDRGGGRARPEARIQGRGDREAGRVAAEVNARGGPGRAEGPRGWSPRGREGAPIRPGWQRVRRELHLRRPDQGRGPAGPLVPCRSGGTSRISCSSRWPSAAEARSPRSRRPSTRGPTPSSSAPFSERA